MKMNRRNNGTSWKIGLAALVGIFLIAMAASLTLANRRVSRVVDPDYYRNGLHYGERLSSVEKR